MIDDIFLFVVTAFAVSKLIVVALRHAFEKWRQKRDDERRELEQLLFEAEKKDADERRYNISRGPHR